MVHDTSSVFHKAMLDDSHAKRFCKDWLFETDGGIKEFDTEGEACDAQQLYRFERGFDPMSGEKA